MLFLCLWILAILQGKTRIKITIMHPYNSRSLSPFQNTLYLLLRAPRSLELNVVRSPSASLDSKALIFNLISLMSLSRGYILSSPLNILRSCFRYQVREGMGSARFGIPSLFNNTMTLKIFNPIIDAWLKICMREA